MATGDERPTHPPSLPPGAPELEAETRLGDKPATRAVNEMLLALSRAARSFTLYDHDNESVRRLIERYRETTRAALDACGAIALDVQPFEIKHADTVVYREAERERSLAFRLFRDGVRRIAFDPEASWDELLRFLEVFSIRYVGVRQQEDDMVTLLRKAQLKNIAIESVEGFVPDEEDPEGATEDDEPAVPRDLPPGWDRPLPGFTQTAEASYRAIPQGHLEALRSEEAETSLAPNAVRALRELLAQGDALDAEGVVAFAQEVGELLVVDGRADLLLVLVRDLRAAFGDTVAVQEAVRRFIGPKVLERFLSDAGTEQEPAIIDLLALVPGDHLTRVLDLLGEATSEERRALLSRIVARLAGADPGPVLSRLREAPPALAASLFQIVATVAPDRLVQAALALVDHPDPEFQLGVLHVLAGAKGSAELGHALEKLLDAESSMVRIGAAEVYVKRIGSRAFAPLRARLEARVKAGIEPEEAEAFGRVLVRASQDAAMERFRAWIGPSRITRLLRRLHKTQPERLLEIASVAGLAELGTDEARALIGGAATGDADLAQRCEAALERMGETSRAR